MLVSPAAPGQPAAAARTTEISGKSGAQVPVDANVLSMMMMAQQQQATQPGGVIKPPPVSQPQQPQPVQPQPPPQP